MSSRTSISAVNVCGRCVYFFVSSLGQKADLYIEHWAVLAIGSEGATTFSQETSLWGGGRVRGVLLGNRIHSGSFPCD